MTRSEATQICQSIKFILENSDYTEAVEEALDMAIEALEQEEALQNLTKPNKSDLISRQAAIDVVRQYCIDNQIEDGDYHANGIEYELNELPTVQPFTSEQIQTMQELESAQVEKAYELGKADRAKWIPCSERMPEEREWIGTEKFGTTISDKVLVTFESRGERFVKPMKFQNGELGGMDKHTMDAFYDEWKAVAWMPLPEAYREDGEEE